MAAGVSRQTFKTCTTNFVIYFHFPSHPVDVCLVFCLHSADNKKNITDIHLQAQVEPPATNRRWSASLTISIFLQVGKISKEDCKQERYQRLRSCYWVNRSPPIAESRGFSIFNNREENRIKRYTEEFLCKELALSKQLAMGKTRSRRQVGMENVMSYITSDKETLIFWFILAHSTKHTTGEPMRYRTISNICRSVGGERRRWGCCWIVPWRR